MVEQKRSCEDEIRHNCGIAGAISLGDREDVTSMVGVMLHHLNHRGQEGAGIAVHSHTDVRCFKGEGWSKHVITDEVVRHLSEIEPNIAIGHDRYSVSGEADAWQPIVTNGISIVQNGNCTNAMVLKSYLPPDQQRSVSVDTEILSLRLNMLMRENKDDLLTATRLLAQECEGANNLIIAGNNMLVAIRDPWGFHPLSIGKNGQQSFEEGTYVVASETSAYESPLDMHYVRDVHPGEGIVIDSNGLRTFFIDERVERIPRAQCIFELIYFASPDGFIFGEHVGTIRENLGRALARQDIAEGYEPGMIIPVQQSGIVHASGYSKEYQEHYVRNKSKLGLTDEELAEKISSLSITYGLIRNPYSGRTFINPDDPRLENSGKHRIDRRLVRENKVTFVDDSIVKGNAQFTISELMDRAGGGETHVRIACPPIKFGCFWGVDFPDQSMLIASHSGSDDMLEEDVANAIHAQSLRYLSPKTLLETVLGQERFQQLVVEQPDNELSLTELNSDQLVYGRSGYCGSCLHGAMPTNPGGVFSKNN